MKQVEVDSQGKVNMGAALYGSLKRMLDAGLVKESDKRIDPEMDDERRSTTRLQASARRRSRQNLSAINISSRWRENGNSYRKPLRMANDQETVRTLYKKLLSFYPRAFRERLGESMGQTFNDLCNERKQQTEQGWFGFVLWVFVETAIGIIKEQALLIKQGDTMKTITTNPRSAAIISFILALPLAILFPIAVFEIEPFNGFYKTLFTEANGYRATALGLTVEGIAMLLLPVAFIVNLVPIVRNVRTGNSVMANPINLLLAVALLVFIAMTWG